MTLRHRLVETLSCQVVLDGDPDGVDFTSGPRLLAIRSVAQAHGFRRVGLIRINGCFMDQWVHADDATFGLTITDCFYMLRTLSRSGERIVTFSHTRPSATTTDRMTVRPGARSFLRDVRGHRAAVRRLAGTYVPLDTPGACLEAELSHLREDTSIGRLLAMTWPVLTLAFIHLAPLPIAGLLAASGLLGEATAPMVIGAYWPLLAALKALLGAGGGAGQSRVECEADTDAACTETPALAR